MLMTEVLYACVGMRLPFVLTGVNRSISAPITIQVDQQDFQPLVGQGLGGHVLLATVYYRSGRKEDGDRERALVEKLKAERREQELAAPGSAGFSR